VDHLADNLAIAPEAEGVPIRVDRVGKRLQLAPLILVVRIGEAARVRAFARSLDLDEADKGLADRDRVVRARLQVGESGLANELDRAGGQAADLGKVVHQDLQGPAQLILRRACDGRARQLRFGACAKNRDGSC